jgi:hypothetical protein
VIADPTVPDAALDAIACVAGPGCPIDVIAGAPVSRGPFGQDVRYRRGLRRHNAVIHELRSTGRRLIHEFTVDVDDSWKESTVARGTSRAQPPMANISIFGRSVVAWVRSSE